VTDLSLVVLTWNGRELTLSCLASVDAALRRPGLMATETVLVDNGSGDGTVEAVRARFPWVRILALPRNVGFAAGNNAGLAEARGGRYVALLNNDTVVLPGVFEACVAFLDAHPDVGAVGPRLVGPDGRAQNSIHAYPTLLGELVPRGVLETLFPRRWPSKRRRLDGPVDVEAVLGACIVARRTAVEEVGPLPEDYFFFLEETDWLYRMTRCGWRVVHLPNVQLVHVHGAATKKKVPLATRIEYHRSLYHFFRKHGGPARLAAVMGVRVARLLLALVVLAPASAVSQRERARWRERLAILGWHLRGCPASEGLSGVAAAEEAA
jgi:GT2 family glycosyltransferase